MSEESYESFPGPDDLENLTDEEVEEVILDRIEARGEIETENLAVQCQNGIVAVEGILPTAAQYRLLLDVLRDELSLEDVVDRVRIQDEVVFSDDDEEYGPGGDASGWWGDADPDPEMP